MCAYALYVSLFPYPKRQKLLGVHADTPRRWEREGKIKPRRTSGNLRRYDIADIRPDLIHAAPTPSRKTAAYARVSSHDQKEDLERQKQVLESYCAAQGWTFELVADLGSGMNYRKRSLQKLLNQIIAGDVGRISAVSACGEARSGAVRQNRVKRASKKQEGSGLAEVA
jgi:putative resolvase